MGIEPAVRNIFPNYDELIFVPIQGIFLAKTGGFYVGLWGLLSN